MGVAIGLVLGGLLALWPGLVPGAHGEPTATGVSRYWGEKLHTIEWQGNRAASGGDLSQASGWRAGVALDENLWSNLDPSLRRLYSQHGFLDFRIAGVDLTPSEDGLEARIRLEEGERYRLGSVSIDGVRGAEEEKVRRELGLASGDHWSEEQVEAGIGRVLERYTAAGRPFAQMRLRQVTVGDGAVSLDFLVVASDTVWVDSVRVEGLQQTRAHVVDRLVGHLSGNPYDPATAREARTRLFSLGVFSFVDAPELLLTSAGRGLLVYRVQEAPSNAFEGAFGYQGEGLGAVGFARLHIGNLAGTARQADVVWEGRGQGVSLFDLHYGEPFVAGLPVRGDLNFTQEFQGEAYSRTDAAVSAGFGLGGGGTASLGLNLGRVVVGSGDVSQSSRWGVRFEASRGAGIPLATLGALRAGSYRVGFLAGLEFVGETLRDGGESRGQLTTLGLDAGVARPSSGQRFLSLSLQSRARFADQRVIPVYDLFSLGGVRSLRGYREDAFRAARLALLRAEYGLLFPRSRVFLFLDQAVFHRARPALDSTGAPETRYRAGYGLGTSYVSPLGELALLLGWGEGTGPLDAKLHLQLLSRF
jgi:outer membrane protein assembly factor BamA